MNLLKKLEKTADEAIPFKDEIFAFGIRCVLYLSGRMQNSMDGRVFSSIAEIKHTFFTDVKAIAVKKFVSMLDPSWELDVALGAAAAAAPTSVGEKAVKKHLGLTVGTYVRSKETLILIRSCHSSFGPSATR
jgi:hypothetical protein